jgi:hypothetical protein
MLCYVSRNNAIEVRFQSKLDWKQKIRTDTSPSALVSKLAARLASVMPVACIS